MSTEKKVEEHIAELRNKKFYGEILVKFENGKVVIVKETASKKLS